jgi:aspartyl-tRNA(Asn)/glutamyl-tRNA(Gln) amidotransferase subunit B
MENYYVVIGLEVHAELDTKSKMWCGCKNDPYEKKPNRNVCEVCMAHPGTLPVPNKEAIRKVIQVGLAVQDAGKNNIADFTEFDRKNYYYPDIPKGYQLTQYKFPVVTGGIINNIPLTRIHLEEDTAKSSHEGNITVVDYNRAGVPLMELVTDPVKYESKEDAAHSSGEFARELQRILRYTGASEANMELGQMRVEANISVSKDKDVYGTKCEVKNLNSIASVESAIKFEVERHIALIEEGGKVVQETRGWDENKLETFSQRKKENAHDYRYFPDPDLPKLYLSKLFDLEAMKKELPELPKERRVRYSTLGIKPDFAGILVDDVFLASYFDEVTKGKDTAFSNLASNYLLSDLLGLLKKENKVTSGETLPLPTVFISLLIMIQEGKLSSRGAKDLLPFILDAQEVNVTKLAEEKGLIQKNDPEALKKIVDDVLAKSATQIADYKAGKESMFMYFVGQCMKESKGAGNPQLFQEILKERLA